MKSISMMVSLLMFMAAAMATAMAGAQAPAPVAMAASSTAKDLKDQEIRLLRQQLARVKARADKDGIGRLVFETQLQVLIMRGFKTTKPVVYQDLTDKRLNEVLDESIAKQYPGRSLDLYVWFYTLFGAMPEQMDILPFMRDLMGEQVGGLYDPSSKVLFVKPHFPLDSSMGRMVLAHEITHALQDQNYSFKGLGLEETGNDDRSTALLSIAEGDATLLMSEYLAQSGQLFGLLFDLPKMLTMDQAKFNASPQAIQQMMLFPYLGGMEFFTRLNGRTRQLPDSPPRMTEPAWRSEVFEDPPDSTEQIMHPEKYLAREMPVEVERPAGEGLASKFENVIGEFGIKLLLGANLPEPQAARAAAGWGGDRVLLEESEDGRRRVIHWVTRWDTRNDGLEFADTLKEALAKRWPDEIMDWKRTGDKETVKIKSGTMTISRLQADRVDFLCDMTIQNPRRQTMPQK